MDGGGEGRRAREIVHTLKSGYLWILSTSDKGVSQCVLLTRKISSFNIHYLHISL